MSGVHPSDLAAEAGIEPGCVITALQGEPVLSHEEAIRVASHCPGLLTIAFLNPRQALKLRADQEWAGVRCVLWWAAFALLHALVLAQLVHAAEERNGAREASRLGAWAHSWLRAWQRTWLEPLLGRDALENGLQSAAQSALGAVAGWRRWRTACRETAQLGELLRVLQ